MNDYLRSPKDDAMATWASETALGALTRLFGLALLLVVGWHYGGWYGLAAVVGWLGCRAYGTPMPRKPS